eukprot:m.11042 g.11042  ORF g.11042 m.11042 type:complete len:196 (+) comp3766_c0_seq1:288-875(+)
MDLIVYPNQNYNIDHKSEEETYEKIDEKMAQLKEKTKGGNVVESVYLVLLIEVYQQPHILLIQPHPKYSILPGGELEDGESLRDGIERYLRSTFSIEDQDVLESFKHLDTMCSWYRPNFEQPTYPYVPPHCGMPKEHLSVVLLQMPQRCSFVVAKNCHIRAVPLIDVFDNKESFGSLIASLPAIISKYNMIYAEE